MSSRAEDRELPLENGWFAIGKQSHGSWSKILDADALNVTLYWGAISRTNAYPETFRTLLDEEAGFWPGAPDEKADIDPNTFAEQIERLSGFLARAQALTVQRMEFDLLLAYQPVVDEALHNFLGYDAAILHRAYLAADRAAAAVGSQLDGNRDAFLVMGDHGLVPITREIRLGVLLAQQQFAPRWRVFTAITSRTSTGPATRTTATRSWRCCRARVSSSRSRRSPRRRTAAAATSSRCRSRPSASPPRPRRRWKASRTPTATTAR